MVRINSKHAFWVALVFTITIFLAGIFLGFLLEGTRENIVSKTIINSEINLLDEQIRTKIIGDLNVRCGVAVESTFRFADKIYEEASLMEDYGRVSNFGNNLEILHKRYDLLRTILWIESIELKERCKEDFHTIVYLYEYNPKEEDINLRAEQIVFERVLLDLKYKYPDKIILIPIAVNLGLESVNLIVEKYNIRKAPVIIIDEHTVIDKISSVEELEKIIF